MKAKKKPIFDQPEDFLPAAVVEPGAGEDRPDDQVEGSLRPRSLTDYIGQEGVKQNLRIAIDAAKQRGDVLGSLPVLRPARTWQDFHGPHHRAGDGGQHPCDDRSGH